MKKKIGVIIAGIIIVLLVFYIGNSYHFMYNSVCGTGLTGLRLVGIVTLISILALLIIIILSKGNNKNQKSYCMECSAAMQDDWNICPYCGSDRIGGR